jgi:hypothetical protein
MESLRSAELLTALTRSRDFQSNRDFQELIVRAIPWKTAAINRDKHRSDFRRSFIAEIRMRVRVTTLRPSALEWRGYVMVRVSALLVPPLLQPKSLEFPPGVLIVTLAVPGPMMSAVVSVTCN